MIQQHQDYFQKDQLSRLLVFNNAIYQGGYCPTRKLLNGNGIVYFPKHKRVIVCRSFRDGQIHNGALVYHSAQRYLYGSWKNSKLEGLALIRISDLVLVAYFQSGKIRKQSKVVLFLNQYQLGVLLFFKNGEWETLQRTEIYCKQHILNILKKCEFGEYLIPLSLISFLNQEIAVTPNQKARLRFVNNTYEYGFESGLHLVFSRDQQLTGLKFNNQGFFNVYGERSEEQEKRLSYVVGKSIQRQRTAQAGTIHKQKQTNNQYILAKELADPSSPYFSYLQTTFNQGLLKKLRAGLFRASKNKNIEQFHLQLFPVNTETFPATEEFQSQLQQSIIEPIDEQQEDEQYSWQKSVSGRDNVKEISSFQMLPQESRLNIIKQQQRQILHSRIQRQKRNQSQSQSNPSQENVSLSLSEECHQKKQKVSDKQCQTNVVLLTSPLTTQFQTVSPLSQKRRRAKIFTESPVMTPSPHKITENKYMLVQTAKTRSNKVDKVNLCISPQKAVLPQQIQSRIAKEMQNECNDPLSVNQINCSPARFKNKQFSLANFQIVSPPKTDKSYNHTIQIKEHPKQQLGEQNASTDPRFVAIRRSEEKSTKRYDTQGLSDKKLLFDYILI